MVTYFFLVGTGFFDQFSLVSFLWKPRIQIVSRSSIPSNLQKNDKHIFPTGRDVNCMSIFLPLLVWYSITITMLMMGDVGISLAKCHSLKYKSISRLHWLLVASSINPIAKAVLWLIFCVWFIPRLCQMLSTVANLTIVGSLDKPDNNKKCG